MICSKDEGKSTFGVYFEIHNWSPWIERPVVKGVNKAVSETIKINHVELVVVAQDDSVSRG